MSPETANTIRHAADVTQWGALGVIVTVLAVILLAGYRWPEWRRVLALPLLYSVLAIAFYVATLMNLVPAPWTSLLSAALRLYVHVLMLTVLGVAVYVAYIEERDAGGDDGE